MGNHHAAGQSDGSELVLHHPSEIMDEVAALTPSFAGVSYALLEERGSVQWPCNEKAPDGTPIMHIDAFVRGKGRFIVTEYVPTEERTGARFPLLLTTGRILSQYNVGAQTRRTENTRWHRGPARDQPLRRREPRRPRRVTGSHRRAARARPPARYT